MAASRNVEKTRFEEGSRINSFFMVFQRCCAKRETKICTVLQEILTA